MIEFLDFHKEDLLAVRVTNKIAKKDFDILKDELTKKFRQFKKINWYYEMINFKGWDFNTFFEDLPYSLNVKNKFNKVGFVGDKSVEKVMAKIYSLIAPSDVRYFDIKETDDARQWIKDDSTIG